MRQVKDADDFLLGTKMLMAGLMELATWPPDEKWAPFYENLKNIRDMINAAPFVYINGSPVPAELDSPEKGREIANIARAFTAMEMSNAMIFGVPDAAGMTC